MNSCKFCGRTGSSDVLICSVCTQKLLALDKAQIRALYDLCVERGLVEKASLIFKLLMEDENGEQSKGYFEKRINGERPVGFTGIDKKSSHRPSIEKKAAVH